MRLELMTFCLQGKRSTAELKEQKKIQKKYKKYKFQEPILHPSTIYIDYLALNGNFNKIISNKIYIKYIK